MNESVADVVKWAAYKLVVVVEYLLVVEIVGRILLRGHAQMKLMSVGVGVLFGVAFAE